VARDAIIRALELRAARPNLQAVSGLFWTLAALVEGRIVTFEEHIMNLTRFEPWSLVDLLHRDLDRLAQGRLSDTQSENPAADWAPAVDIVEEKDRVVLRADVPGVDPADIDVSMDGGVLTVSGERRTETRSEAEGFRRVERSFGRFHRRFNLPDTADAEGIKATSSKGILEISIPKLPEVKARRISVEAA
jgi:HSP20 family protein